MNTSDFLGLFWGWYLIIFFLILSLNPSRIRQIFSDLNDEKFLILASLFAIVIGLLNILFHNIWEANWRIIITLMGWLALYIGLSLFIFPKQTVSFLKFINVKLVQVIYILLFLTGVYLLNAVYEVVPI
ncbi:hypothetical protein [Gaetbulibacter aestuarii]|uniref:Uncharacterized protein n=1 Tax=Gaetbulibacter aestuarii TaxID=1502358 RepID=A0ABW7MWX7_9FLAO